MEQEKTLTPNQFVVALRLSSGPATGKQLLELLQGRRSAFYCCIHRLKRGGYVNARRCQGLTPDVTYTLTQEGRDCLAYSIGVYKAMADLADLTPPPPPNERTMCR